METKSCNRDPKISSVPDEIKRSANERAAAKQLLDNRQDVRRLKRSKPHSLNDLSWEPGPLPR